jgi:hypothetical protein
MMLDDLSLLYQIPSNNSVDPLDAFRKQMYMKYLNAIYNGASIKREACIAAGVKPGTILVQTEITLKALTYNNEQLLLTLSIKYNEISYNTIIIRERIRRASMMLSHKDNIDTEGSV